MSHRPENPMLQRCFNHDYRGRSIYLITLTIEGRRPMLGTLHGTVDNPSIQLSSLGMAVDRSVHDIPSFYPQIRILAHQVMPDHLHIVLFVTQPIPVPLGEVLTGFKLGTSRHWWHQLEQQGLLAPKQPKPPSPPNGSSHKQGADLASREAVVGPQQYHYASPPRLWAEGFHDRLLLRKGQLKTMLNYVADNPRRLAIKKLNPELFVVRHQLTHNNLSFDALGNHYLLQQPERIQVQCSRSITPEELEQYRQQLLAAAHHGAVLVSPCISPGEKAIAHAALDQGLPLVVLLENGFAPLFKPSGRYFEACANGLLLMLAPWPYHSTKQNITRSQCLQLNAMASQLCQ